MIESASKLKLIINEFNEKFQIEPIYQLLQWFL